MSATRDKNQKFQFIYSNLYQIYRKGKEAADQAGAVAREPVLDHFKPLQTSSILKADDLAAMVRNAVAAASPGPSVTPPAAPAAALKVAPRVSEYRPVELIGKRIARPEYLTPSAAQSTTLNSLKDNLKALNDLHSRLRFMLEELEELVKE